MPWLQLRFDYDTTTTYRARLLPFNAIRREQKMNMSIFRRSRIVVESQLWYRLNSGMQCLMVHIACNPQSRIYIHKVESRSQGRIMLRQKICHNFWTQGHRNLITGGSTKHIDWQKLKVKGLKPSIALNGKPITELYGASLAMGSHSGTRSRAEGRRSRSQDQHNYGCPSVRVIEAYKPRTKWRMKFKFDTQQQL